MFLLRNPLRSTVALASLALLAGCAESVTEPTAAPAALLVPHAPAHSVAPLGTAAALPRYTVPTTYVVPTGRRLLVPAGANLQTALDTARSGDIVLLAKGATYTGNFTLKAKGNAADIVIETSGATIPATTRVTPTTAVGLAKIASPNASPALTVAPGAAHYRVQQVEITASAAATSSLGLVVVGTSGTAQDVLAEVPSYIVLDRVYVHGTATLPLKRCVSLNAAWSAVVNSYLADCHSATQDSQAIAAWNTPGPLRIANNHLAAAGETVMFGGAAPSIPNATPSDVEIVGNYFTKPVSWKGVWMVKNIFELKFGQRILLEGNVLENCWTDAQRGFAFVLKTEVDSSTPWLGTQDVTIRYNKIRNATGGFAISAVRGAPGVSVRRVVIENNELSAIGTFNGTTYGRMFQLVDTLADVRIVHNTAIPNGGPTLAMLDGKALGTNLTVSDNVLVRLTDGWYGSAVGEGTAALKRYWAAYQMTNNVIVGITTSKYPANNFGPAALADVGFTSVSQRSYQLLSTSPYAGKATDGKNPGADYVTLNLKTAKAITGA